MHKIGALGGTFDPIHNGHLLAAEEVRQKLGLDKIIFVPSGEAVFKGNSVVSTAAHRFNLCLLATASNPNFAVSDIEIKRSGLSYTVDTISQLRQIYPTSQIFFIIGTDAAEKFHKWKNFDKILRLCNIVVVSRPGSRPNLISTDFLPVEITQVDISSTKIRQKLEMGESVRYLIPDVAIAYISGQNLYVGLLAKLSQELEIELSRPRFLHSLSVMEEAVKLGRCYNADEKTLEKLKLAGLLHDCAKNICEELPFADLVKYCNSTDSAFFDFFQSRPDLVHSFVGATLASEKYGISEPDILSAIGCHTFGKPGMNFIDKAVYLADFIEPTRNKNEARQTARKLAYDDIDAAMIFVLRHTLERNKARGQAIYEASRLTLEYLEG